MKKQLYTFILLGLLSACTREQQLSQQDIHEETFSAKSEASLHVDVEVADFGNSLPNYLQVAGLPKYRPNNQKAGLGRVLFYDKNLSSDRTVSCASCHQQRYAFGDNKAFSEGVGGQKGTRNSMALANTASFGAHYSTINGKKPPLLWDGRAEDVFSQAPLAFTNPHEMNLTMPEIVQRVESEPYYAWFFEQAYGDPTVTEPRILEALQEFVNAIGTHNSQLDRGLEGANGDFNAQNQTVVISDIYYGTITSAGFPGFTLDEMRGRDVFVTHCTKCHSPVRPFQEEFLACIGLDSDYADEGLATLTGNASDAGKFKAPSLRNITLTAPYMHDGRFATLEEVVNFYSDRVKDHSNLHPLLRQSGFQGPGFHFTAQEKSDLIKFLKTFEDVTICADPRFSNPFYH